MESAGLRSRRYTGRQLRSESDGELGLEEMRQGRGGTYEARVEAGI